MIYEWDENKRFADFIKHNVDFLDAERFEWTSAIETIDDRAGLQGRKMDRSWFYRQSSPRPYICFARG